MASVAAGCRGVGGDEGWLPVPPGAAGDPQIPVY